ncbi:MAG: heat-inducible transcription repressor HrcA [Clostridia bacterium]|nr:heat-inducible transcription repressor HrcA [Clostridia bacterium]MCI9275559.1 heat-inducible transcription repressor HrcA [Clostridia bacterium]
MLDERKRKILKEIVDEYIESAEPVSSAVIVEKYEQDISSATVRNDMAELEKAGYLEKPHTSAGRIPSAKGYRLYVDELLKYDNISLEEIKYIQEKLETKATGLEELIRIATTTLSEITHYTTVSIGPKTSKQIIEEIKFVLLGSRMLMGIVVTDTGLVRETIIKFDEDITEEQVDTLNYFFNNKLKGEPFENIDTSFEDYIFRELKYSVNIIRPIIDQMKKLIEDEEKIYLEGTNKSFELPEFQSLDLAKNFVNILDTKEVMLDILNSGFAEDIKIYIGDENDNEDLKDFSIVTFKHAVGEKDIGTIGIIGPKRMNYSKVISVMKYISKKLNDDLNDKNK